MKRFIPVALIAIFGAFSALAEGYQVNTLSARQNGMGHTGTALKLGAESMIFNPAGLGYMNGTLDFSGSVTGIFASAKCTLPNGQVYNTSNSPSTPMSFNLGMSVYDNLKVGISFYTPYGSGINWGEDWPGAVLNQSVTLKTFTLQPTISWRILPNLSVGAGAMVTWGTVDLNKGLVSGDSFAYVLQAAGANWPASTTPASVNLNGKSKVAVGFNVGAMWDITKQVTVGTSFRSKMDMKVDNGVASLKYANEMARMILQERLDVIDEAEFEATMPCVAVWNIGVGYKPTKKLTLAFDAQLSFWSAYKSLDVDFKNELLTPYDQHIEKDYRNSWTFKLGSQYAVTDRFDARLGLMIDTTPVRDDKYNPETPGMTKLSPSLGFSFRPIKNFSVDFGLLYVAGLGKKDASVLYPDLLLSQVREFKADYKVHAWNPSIGVGFKF